MVQARGWLLLTNDDGIEAIGFELLVKALHEAGYRSPCWLRPAITRPPACASI